MFQKKSHLFDKKCQNKDFLKEKFLERNVIYEIFILQLIKITNEIGKLNKSLLNMKNHQYLDLPHNILYGTLQHQRGFLFSF